MKSDYYTTTGRKIGDFFIGFGGMMGVGIFLSMLAAGSNGRGWQAVFLLGGSVVIVGPILFFAIGRRHIAIGILCTLLLPLLALGACFVALS